MVLLASNELKGRKLKYRFEFPLWGLGGKSDILVCAQLKI